MALSFAWPGERAGAVLDDGSVPTRGTPLFGDFHRRFVCGVQFSLSLYIFMCIYIYMHIYIYKYVFLALLLLVALVASFRSSLLAGAEQNLILKVRARFWAV